MEINEKEIEKIQLAIKEGNERTREILSKPIVQERGLHRKNWAAHLELLTVLELMVCPCCGKSGLTHLRWVCHQDMTIEEAKNKAGNNYEKSSQREEIDPRFWNEEVQKRALKNLDTYFKTGKIVF